MNVHSFESYRRKGKGLVLNENPTESKHAQPAGPEQKPKKKKARIFRFPMKIGHKLLLLADLLVRAVVLVMMTLVDAFPKMLVLVLLIFMALMLFVIWQLLSSHKKRTRRRILGTILSVIYLAAFGMGSYYLFGTYNLFARITDSDTQHEIYYVVVPADSPYEKVEDIEGKDVFIVDTVDVNYVKAEAQLRKEYGVNYEELHTVMGIMKRMIGEKKAPENIAFIGKATYDVLCEEYENFEEDTRVLYEIRIELDASDIAKRANVTEEPFNIYVSGIDVFGEIDQVSRSDVNMIITVNPKTRKILLTSIPRDSYVVLHTYQQPDKLTHSGIYGIRETVSTVEDWLGFDMNYYLRVNFTTLIDVVDAIGGIDVYSPVAFTSYINEATYVEGMNHLDGRQALYFARERHAFEEGDEARNENQQRVLKAILDKLLSSTTLLTSYDSLLAAVQDEMQTNMKTSEITALVKMQLADPEKWTIKTIQLHGTGGQGGTFSMGLGRMLYVSYTDEDSLQEVQAEIDAVLHPSEEELAAVEEREKEKKKEQFWDSLIFWKN